MEKLLTISGIDKSYRNKKVLSGLELTIEAGKIYGLIGRNGAGKTTLLSIMTGQNRPDAGSVTYGGEPVWENRHALDAICFSRELSSPWFSGQNSYRASFFLRAAADFYPRWDNAYAEQLLKEFDLDPRKRLSTLSKGQISALAIIIALASKAPVTILDEPVSGLDVVMREKFYALLLDDHINTGRSFIVSTHIIEEAADVFEEVIILDEGKIIEKAPTEELIAQFAFLSGRADLVDRSAQGLTILSSHTLGLHKTLAVRGITPDYTPCADVDISPMSLQNVFVTLCGHENKM